MFPLIVRFVAVEPSIVRFLVIIISPLVKMMTEFAGRLKSIVSPSTAAAIWLRSVPAPLSAVLLTVRDACGLRTDCGAVAFFVAVAVAVGVTGVFVVVAVDATAVFVAVAVVAVGVTIVTAWSEPQPGGRMIWAETGSVVALSKTKTMPRVDRASVNIIMDLDRKFIEHSCGKKIMMDVRRANAISLLESTYNTKRKGLATCAVLS